MNMYEQNQANQQTPVHPVNQLMQQQPIPPPPPPPLPVKKEPVDRFTAGKVQGAVWENQGEFGKHYNLEISKQWKDKQDKWQKTYNLSPTDGSDAKIIIDCFLAKYRLKMGGS